MHWTKPLAFFITPKSGPLRRLETLLDANHALSKDLPKGFLQRSHWMRAGKSLVIAAESGLDADIRTASDLILEAIEQEGWMTRAPRQL